MSNIEYEKNVTIDDIVNEANLIWKKIKKYSYKTIDESEKVIKIIQKEHPQISKSYPIVIRYMVQRNAYSNKALRTYLNKVKNNPWTTEDEYIESQVDYTIILYKYTNKNWNTTQISNLRKNTLDALHKEKEIFKNSLDVYEKEVNEERATLDKRCDNEVKKLFMNLGEEIIKYGGTYRVESEYGSSLEVDMEKYKIPSLDEIIKDKHIEDEENFSLEFDIN
jgi:hypothetical protein